MTKDYAFLKASNDFIRLVDDRLVPGVPNTKKIVFLDIDGVIDGYYTDERLRHDLTATANYLALKYHDDIYKTIRQNDLGAAYYNWNSVALGRLQQLLYETRSEIVLHSDYCFGNSLEQLKALFKLHGMDDYLIGKCNDKPKLERIKDYLEEYKDIIENYVIFDDNDKAHLEEFGEHFILTKNLLTNKNIKKAEKILEIVL